MSLVLQLTREGYILSWTEDASILLGFSAQISGACTLADAIHLDQNHAALLVERLAAGVSFTMSAVLVQQPTATEALCYDVEAWPIVDGSSTTGFFVKFSRCHEASDADRKQRISESSFELITGNLSAMVYRALNDEHWSIQFASEAAFSILGVEADDLMSGKFSPAELVHPDDLEDVRLNIEEGLAARQPIHHQFRIITPDGETKWLDEKCRGVYDESGAVVAIEGLVFDIAKERELHVELARRNAALQVFVDRLPVAIAMFDTNMRYILHSKRWLFNFGLTESLVGQVHYDVFPNLPEKFISAHQKGLEGESHPRTVDCFIKSNGDEMWVRWELHPWFDDANNVGGIIIFSEDVSAEKQVSDEMVRVSHAVDAAEDAVFMLNPDTLDFFYVNDGAVRQTGYSREELLTMNPINLSPEYTLEQMFALVAPLTNNEVDRLSIEAIHLRKDHRAVPVEINLQRIEDINARLVIMGVARDRTEQKLAERLLQQSEERYRTIVSSMSDLIFVFNFEGYFIDVHYRSNDQLIFPKEAFMGRKISEVFDGPIADEFLAHLSELQRTGQTQSYDYTINQESVPTYYQATMNVDPEYTKVTVNVRNITVRKRMEIELKLREEILSAVSYVASALLTSAHWHEAMPESLRRLGEAAIADRVYLFTRGSDELGRDVVSQLFEWCSEGTSPEIDNPLMQNLRMPEIGYERWEEFFRQGESIRGRIADLPESERHYLEA